MNRYETPNSCCSAASRLRICAWMSTSRADTGSSSTTSRGSSTSARAMATRWRWPPDSSAGRRLVTDSARPTRSSQVTARRRCSARPPMPNERSGSATMSPTLIAGFSDVYGFWNTYWISCRSLRRLSPRAVVTSCPSTRTRPLVGWASRSSIRATVVLPDPDSPTSPRVSPRATLRLTSSTARNAVLPPAASGTWKSLTRCSAWRTTSPAVRGPSQARTPVAGRRAAAARLGAASMRDFV